MNKIVWVRENIAMRENRQWVSMSFGQFEACNGMCSFNSWNSTIFSEQNRIECAHEYITDSRRVNKIICVLVKTENKERKKKPNRKQRKKKKYYIRKSNVNEERARTNIPNYLIYLFNGFSLLLLQCCCRCHHSPHSTAAKSMWIICVVFGSTRRTSFSIRLITQRIRSACWWRREKKNSYSESVTASWQRYCGCVAEARGERQIESRWPLFFWFKSTKMNKTKKKRPLDVLVDARTYLCGVATNYEPNWSAQHSNHIYYSCAWAFQCMCRCRFCFSFNQTNTENNLFNCLDLKIAANQLMVERIKINIHFYEFVAGCVCVAVGQPVYSESPVTVSMISCRFWRT